MSTRFGLTIDEIKEAKFIVIKPETWFKCQNCKYEWLPRNTAKLPKMCPSCQSRHWKGDRDED